MSESSQLIQPSKTTEILFEEKRSRFITELLPVDNEQAIKDRISSLKKSHPKASHVCSAFRIRKDSIISEGFSDDGEPSGTAGMPILKTMRHHNLVNCVVLITRYFGGTKLGTGGLQRAYSHAASEAISSLNEDCYTAVVDMQQLELIADFSEEGILRRLLDEHNAINLTVEYKTAGITISTEVPKNEAKEVSRIFLAKGFNCKLK